MAITLIVQSTSGREPVRRSFDDDSITIGRDPSSVLRFGMTEDLEVSTRHAEIRLEEGFYVIEDKASTNSTWVNGARLREPRKLHPGDVINIGRGGPELRVEAIDDDVWQRTVESRVRLPPIRPEGHWRRNRTEEWVLGVVESRTRSLRIAVVAAGILLPALALTGWLWLRSVESGEQDVWNEVTTPAIRKANDDAVVLVESAIPGRCERGCEGTGFAVASDGVIVTNRHVVQQRGVEAGRVQVKFANTGSWHPAQVLLVSTDPEVDLALLRLVKNGNYPAVIGVSAAGPDLPVGSRVLTIGYPMGTALRMEGTGASAIARTMTTTGAIGKVLDKELQIDATAGRGSSGSPVFDRHGHVIGVVHGGTRDGGRIVFVVPSTQVWRLMKTAGLVAEP